MKRTMALLLALLFVVALFSGCGGNNASNAGGQTAATPAPSAAPKADEGNSGTAPESTPEPEPTEEPSPYHLAAGNFEKDDRGFPTAPYNYDQPLTTADESFTFWTSTFMNQYIPEEGMESLPVPMGMEEQTGVHIEYMVVPWDTRSNNFAVMLASDDLPDISAQGISYYSGTYYEAVSEGYFVNIHDYMDYCPNYIYQATYNRDDLNTYENIFYASDMIIAFYNMCVTPFYTTNKVIRADYLEQVGMNYRDVKTWDDWFNALSAIKSQIDKVEFPWPLTSSIEVKGSYCTSPSFETLGSMNAAGLPDYFIKDGKVTFGNLTENDKAFMQKMNEFYAAGLIDPNWRSYSSSMAFTAKTSNGEIAIMDMAATEIDSTNATCVDPGCDWQGLSRPLLYEGQVLHVGGDLSRVTAGTGNSSVSGRCENIELAVSWCDYRYSPYGSDYNSYGPEGVIWEYDEAGKRTATQWALTHDMGYSWATMFFGLNSLFEHGLFDTSVKTIYDGGAKVDAIRAYWADYDYDGAYEVPAGCRMTADESDTVNSLSADIATYISENYSLFLTGEKSFDEWDDYVSAVFSMGMQEIIDTYQTAYDRYLAA